MATFVLIRRPRVVTRCLETTRRGQFWINPSRGRSQQVSASGKFLNYGQFHGQSDSDTERQQEPAATKRQKAASKNAEQSKRSTNLANMIKERYRKESLKLFDDNSVCDEDCKHLRENRTLLATIKHLKSENERLREQIESSDDLKVSLRKLKKYVASLEGFSNQAPKFGSQQSVRAYEPSARLSPLTTMDHGRSSPISCVSSSSTRSSPTSMSGFSEFATEEPTVIAISEDNLLKDKSKEIQGCDDDN
ncbi:uncharacterized protein LOC114543953 [Dendronephthya gigantea]|uniref:uncharacterized protein LOC114543953 n=1 Tax=Dendronephthya gigantea TaxID=151771 RepID=UPI00106D12F9|nr:uncharacterized protein LOC114543953 [Dendronephthya gigantea]